MKKNLKRVAVFALIFALLIGTASCKKAEEEEDVKPGARDPQDNVTETTLSEEAKAAYRAALENLMNEHILPDGTDCGYDEINDISTNKFAVTDVDGDGRDELVIMYTTTASAGMMGCVYDYDETAKALKQELREFPMLTFYDNGVIKADWSHNQGLAGEFWPYTLYKYDIDSDTYLTAGMVDAWDKNFAETDSEGNAYPEDTDTSKTGIVYYLMEGSTYDNSTAVDKTAYDAWYDSYLSGANELTLNYLDLTADNIANF